LCDECAAHWAAVRRLLDAAGIEYQHNPYLVRGLDYYTRTVFEFYPGGASGQQDALASGGRYDGLAEAEGWPSTPGVGFAGGLDLYGWVARRRDHGGLIFIDLRDRWGVVQVVFNPSHATAAHERAPDLRSEYVVRVGGKVARRRSGAENPRMPTGEVEVIASDLEIISIAKTPPFAIEDDVEADEALRLKYRYLDIRRPTMTHNLELRHSVVQAIHRYMDAQDFMEVETPMLLKGTPEGSRDFIVPSRLHPGEFFALPQSPQQLKQLLMVAGIGRYYQIARCLRDEDLRADRVVEITQLDVEMSFCTEEDVLALIEGLWA